MASVSFVDVQHSYPHAIRPTLVDIDWTIRAGEFAVLYGPPGSGKSTLLRVLAGLEAPTGGAVFRGDLDITRMPAPDRDIVMALDSYALYPHLSVADNLGFVLRLAGLSSEEIEQRVAQAAEQLELTEVLASAPAALTSAQRHRVALGRALVRRPSVLLLDEPLNQLGEEDHEQVREQIRTLQAALRITTIYATSSQDDAQALSGGTMAVLDKGRLTVPVREGTAAP
ncbi:ABC transporter ATP-binding protein [Sediminivirga luteola]|jgi:multiple sugar transport system ATP-binding protein|uniref:ABC transporter domain-containing protein n=1 Tax=Sediminivirga luteola TaxID=1774748 RepID=A0A8J2TVI8_9MICO|nr:ABC transporter ATP-binding protein [Sediminivirga luteola]MCI2264572.1 ABC transporter ATP-binding protein [Sediminivirga luteola]GGA03294.1 hypothetical protein GCM10011333_02490 [Sediminivirga luteola]